MLEGREPSAGPLDLLDAEVLALGRTVGRPGPVVVQDLLPPSLQGVAEGADLVDVVGLDSRRWPCSSRTAASLGSSVR